jgi:hypothetical protein
VLAELHEGFFFINTVPAAATRASVVNRIYLIRIRRTSISSESGYRSRVLITINYKKYHLKNDIV